MGDEELPELEGSDVTEGVMRPLEARGRWNMTGEWLKSQVPQYGGVVRDDIKEPERIPEVSERSIQGRTPKRIAVIRGAAAKKGIEELMRRYR